MDTNDQYWPHSTGSGNGSERRAPLATTSPARVGLNRSDWVRKKAQIVLSSYRRDDFADPDSFAVQLAMVLERYPDSVVTEATSPLTGIQRACKFPPSIAEVVEFCDELQRRSTRTAQWDERSRKQLEDRAAFDAMTKEESLEHRQQVAERIRRGLSENGFPVRDGWTRLGRKLP
jgi:hypothetical protein